MLRRKGRYSASPQSPFQYFAAKFDQFDPSNKINNQTNMRKRLFLFTAMLLVGIVAMMAANPEGATQATAAEGGVMKDITKFCLDSLEYWWFLTI